MTLDEIRAAQHNNEYLQSDAAQDQYLATCNRQAAPLDRAAHASPDEVRMLGRLPQRKTTS